MSVNVNSISLHILEEPERFINFVIGLCLQKKKKGKKNCEYSKTDMCDYTCGGLKISDRGVLTTSVSGKFIVVKFIVW